MRQKQCHKTSLGWSSPVPERLKQVMSDVKYTAWGILSCFQKRAFSFPVGATCCGLDLAYHEREERKSVGFLNHDIKPGRRKGKLFVSSQRRFSIKKYWKWEWILGNGSILHRTLLMILLWFSPQNNRAAIFSINSYRYGKGESGKESGMKT